MKAITVEPKKPETARYEDFPEPDLRDGSILVRRWRSGCAGPTWKSSREVWLGA